MVKSVVCVTLLCCILAATTSALSMKQVADKWKGVGGSTSTCATAVAVAWAESKGNPRARGQNSDSYDRGLWQINSKWHSHISDSCAYDAKCNAVHAKRISSNGNNWSPWTTYRKGLHKRYMNEAKKACGGGGWFDEADNEAFDTAPERLPFRGCRMYARQLCQPGYTVFSVPNLERPECGAKPTGCLPVDQPPANRCRAFYKNMCPPGSVRRFVLNSAQPGCDKIPICYVSQPVPQNRYKMLKDYAAKFDQFDEDDEDDYGTSRFRPYRSMNMNRI